ncbi:RING/FYVE/PHD zinc finger superfamily protein [Trifolium repens]|nr:RING/FYVE/PHD zinc finger superfamily protein [Trifolium repens]
MLLALRKQSAKHETSNGEESRHIQDSPINPAVQPKKVPKFKKVWRPVENMSHEARGSHWYKDLKRKHRNRIRAMVSKNKKCPAESSKRKVRDNMNAKYRGFKCKIGGPTGTKYLKMNNGKRKRVKSSNPKVNALSSSVKSLVELPELTPSSDCVASPKTTPIPAEESSFELQSQHVSVSLSQESKGKEHHKFQNTVEKIDKPQSTSVALNASTGSNKTEFMSSDIAAIAPPQVPATSQREVTEAKEHSEIQNHALERNDQPDSISMEFHAPAGSDINTLIEDSCSNSGAIVIAPPQYPIASQVSTLVAVINDTEMSQSKDQNETLNNIFDSNDQQHLVSMELQDHAGSITNNQTEVVNSDSTAIEVVVKPLASAPPDASLSCFEALTEHGLPTEIEPEVPVCLTCGDEGFEETLVYSNKCEDCALHRYCLDGPVVFTDDVIWFCEDCEQEVVDAEYPDEDTTDSEKGEVNSIEHCVNVVDPQPIVDPIWKGSLQIFHKSNDEITGLILLQNKKITGLIGHLSTLACPKVLEETRNLPNVLNANLLQRSAVWPASFTKFGTNYESIGLYFLFIEMLLFFMN